jgi:hypothetical protein
MRVTWRVFTISKAFLRRKKKSVLNFLYKKTAKNCKNQQCCCKKYSTVLILRTFKKIFNSWHYPFNDVERCKAYAVPPGLWRSGSAKSMPCRELRLQTSRRARPCLYLASTRCPRASLRTTPPLYLSSSICSRKHIHNLPLEHCLTVITQINTRNRTYVKPIKLVS